MKNKIIVIMGGGTAGWVSALYFLNKSKDLNLNLKIKLISSNEIEPIGVGEGTLPSFTNFIENICKIDKEEFLRETKGSFKYGTKFDNWNFDNQYYYNLIFGGTNYDAESDKNEKISFDFAQYIINNDINISQKSLLRTIIRESYDIIENNKIALNIVSGYSYHFSASLLITFLKKKCLEFKNFKHIEETIENISYDETGFISKLKISNNQELSGDFFVNCLGFKSNILLGKEYFDIESWDNYILNDSAFAIQVKNSPVETIEPYTTAKAQEYGWCWKVPQYEKTGYGYVYSSDFIKPNEEKLYNTILKTYNIKEKNVFKTKIVKSKPFLNKKQLHKNCLSLGLAAGFLEPLEATSIHMTLMKLNAFFEMIENEIELNEKYINVFNQKIEKMWRNAFKFIIYLYFTNNPINDYWKHYKNIQQKNIFNFYEKYTDNVLPFDSQTYFLVSLGKRMKDYYYGFQYEKYLKDNFENFLRINKTININGLYSHNEVLNEINRKNKLKNFNYS